MAIHPLAGKPAPQSMLVDIPHLIQNYYAAHPDVSLPEENVSFGTSGHRGSSLSRSFNEDHILAISQSICLYREQSSITGPLFIGIDTHALSGPAFSTALQVLAANNVEVMMQKGQGYTPTPVISHAILTYNKNKKSDLADGIVITPSHNPPEDGGIKYNPPKAGPADTHITAWIADTANGLLKDNNKDVKKIPYEKALKAKTIHAYDYIIPYVDDLRNIIDMDAIRSSGIRLCADAMGGSGLAYWEIIADRYKIPIDVRNNVVDPTFSFMTVDKDGKIRMDCSSLYAMASLIDLKDNYDIAFGNDPDFDRHGIVTKSQGLMNPNHYLSVAIWYLFQNRTWKPDTAIGKTLVSSSMIDRIATYLGKKLIEVPVGFKWFVDGLIDGSVGFGGEESAGASFLRKNGTVWTTDKDGFIMDLLAAEILAKTGRDPSEHYRDIEHKFGSSVYGRIDEPATQAQKTLLEKLSPDQVKTSSLAGEKITEKLTKAPGNNAPIDGLKVVTENGWFAARPSGTEDVYKIYAESFKGEDHLKLIQEGARSIVNAAFSLTE